jgi:hypothetical protein
MVPFRHPMAGQATGRQLVPLEPLLPPAALPPAFKPPLPPAALPPAFKPPLPTMVVPPAPEPASPVTPPDAMVPPCPPLADPSAFFVLSASLPQANPNDANRSSVNAPIDLVMDPPPQLCSKLRAAKNFGEWRRFL